MADKKVVPERARVSLHDFKIIRNQCKFIADKYIVNGRYTMYFCLHNGKRCSLTHCPYMDRIGADTTNKVCYFPDWQKHTKLEVDPLWEYCQFDHYVGDSTTFSGILGDDMGGEENE